MLLLFICLLFFRFRKFTSFICTNGLFGVPVTEKRDYFGESGLFPSLCGKGDVRKKSRAIYIFVAETVI
jgi:hypothetical protein